jgi:hypothetical protein
MPLEIRELIIRVTVNENNNQPAATIAEEKIIELKNKIIKECMEKILLRLERLNER